MLLLTDGTVMCQNSGAHDWHRLTPDVHGSYVNGTWSALASTTHAPLYYGSAVLRDGRVFRAGGEYDNFVPLDINVVEIFDPVADTWTPVASPPGVTIGDAVTCVLRNGHVLLGNIGGGPPVVYDPVANTWTPTGPKANNTTSEETWALLADGCVLTLDCFGHPHAEKYIPASNSWVSAGNTPGDLVFDVPKEIGPALRLPDGRVFCVGGTGRTALYAESAIQTAPGTFIPGPTLPSIAGFQLGAMDAPGVLTPNGKVLFAVGPVDDSQNYRAPTYLFEYDPAANTVTQNFGAPNLSGVPYNSRMLLLPTGQVLFANSTTFIAVYTPSGQPHPAWRPVITSCPTALQHGHTYTLQGRQLNGLSQACSYGDDAQMATNYPMARIQYPNGRVVYCRTAHHSTMAVATGAAVVSTQFTVPVGAPAGWAKLSVIANGIASAPVAVHIAAVPSAFASAPQTDSGLQPPIDDGSNAGQPGLEKIVNDVTTQVDEVAAQIDRISAQVDLLGTAVQLHAEFIGEQLRPNGSAAPAQDLQPVPDAVTTGKNPIPPPRGDTAPAYR
jgi:hypothetical protein